MYVYTMGVRRCVTEEACGMNGKCILINYSLSRPELSFSLLIGAVGPLPLNIGKIKSWPLLMCWQYVVYFVYRM